MHSSTTTVSGLYCVQQSLSHQLTLVLVTLLCFTGIGHANQERILTSSDGRRIHFRLIQRTTNSIIAVRTSDGKRFVIPLNSLTESDQKFLATWTPKAETSQPLRPSSVSLAGSSTLIRGAYPSIYQPRYSSGVRNTRGGGTRTQTGGCQVIGSRTVVVNPCGR